MYDKSIIYDPETRDFAMYLEGQLVGFAPTYQAAEQELDELVYRLLMRAAADRDAEEAQTELLPDGCRLASEDEAGWTYRMASGRMVWITDEAARVAA